MSDERIENRRADRVVVPWAMAGIAMVVAAIGWVVVVQGLERRLVLVEDQLKLQGQRTDMLEKQIKLLPQPQDLQRIEERIKPLREEVDMLARQVESLIQGSNQSQGNMGIRSLSEKVATLDKKTTILEKENANLRAVVGKLLERDH